jgi:AcrR family transcriptional regulator
MVEDGRTALKVRHRQAILDAAVALIDEGEGARFSADELARRAGVSRRTVFNHFPSLDEVLLGVCVQMLSGVAEQVGATEPTAGADASRVALFDAVAGALRAPDLPNRILQVDRALRGSGADDRRAQAFAQRALAAVAAELTQRLSAQHPLADPLDVALLASLLTHGIGVVAEHWVAAAPASADPDPAQWDHLLDRVIDTVGGGFLPHRGQPPEGAQEGMDRCG